MPDTEDGKIQMAVISNDLKYIKDNVKEIKQQMEEDYVRKSEFEPIQKIVYGLVGLILTAVVGAIIALVIKQPIS